MSEFIDYYKLLNILPTASDELIKRAYRIKSKEMHPDQGGNENEFVLLTEAYEVLSDPAKRKEYDQELAYQKKSKEQSKNRTKENNEKSKFREQSRPLYEVPKFSFDYKRFGKTIFGALIVLSIIAKMLNAFEETAEPESPDYSAVYPVETSEPPEDLAPDIEFEKYEHSNDIPTEIETNPGELSNSISSDIESGNDSIETKESSETETVEELEIVETDFPTYTTTDSSSLYVRYLDRIYKLEEDLQDYGTVWEFGSDAEITQESFVQLTAWDDLLNEIYQTLNKELTEDEFIALRDLQRTWLVKRDNIADAAIVDFVGGSWEVPVYNDALMEETRKRCYWLVMNYME